MVAIAIFSPDPVLRRSLEQLLREDPALTVVGVTDDPSAVLRLIDQDHVDAVLADAPLREQLDDWRIRHNQTAFMVLVDGADEENSLEALYAGARAILPRSAERNEIILAIKAVINGLVVLPRELLATLVNGASPVDELLDRWPSTANAPRARSACCDGGRRFQQSNRTSAGNLLPHRQVSRRRHSRQAQCGQPD
jgi:DNA-binding NarL/FixJ family response regulator